MRNLLSRRRARWVAPIAVVGAIAVGSWATTVSAGASTPDLPALTAAQVLAKAAHPDLAGFSGTIEVAPDLGLPSLSEISGDAGQSVQTSTGFDPTTLLTQTNDIHVWATGDQERLQLDTSALAETDLVRDGGQAWLWDSATQQVTHYVAAAHQAAGHGNESTAGPAVTPEQAAQRFIDHVDPSTTVTVESPIDVAGRPAYQLSFSPKAGTPGAADSTISEVTVTVDSATGTVLSFAVDTTASKTPALSIAFTSFDPSVPAASNFTAPIGRTTKTQVVGGGHPGGAQHQGAPRHAGQRPQVTGSPWAEVLTVHAAHLGPRALAQLDRVSTAVGSDRLIHTSVANALVEPDGTVLVGFVTPAVLEAAAAG